MKAVIMAGGEGTRLRPLTCNRPKPMVPVAGRPVMEHIVRLLKSHGMDKIAVTLQYLPDHICEYFGDGSQFDVRMRYYTENKPLGTAGSVKNAEDFLDETFLVISGDALTDVDLTKAISFHREKGAFATLILKRVDVPLEYGVVVTDGEGKIIRFLEKPGWGEVFSDTVNTGIYILSPEIFDYYKKDQVFDFGRDLFPLLMKEKRSMYGYVTDDYWCDIGDIEAYMQACFDILDGRVRVDIPGIEIKQGYGLTGDYRREVRQDRWTVHNRRRLPYKGRRRNRKLHGDRRQLCRGEYGSIKRSILWKNSFIGEKAKSGEA